MNLDLTQPPDSVFVATENGSAVMTAAGTAAWAHADTEVKCALAADGLSVVLSSPKTAVSRLRLHWRQSFPAGTRYLGDHWERGYGDLEWRGLVPERIMPWYFLAHNDGGTYGCGVKTGAGALSSWTVDSSGISLWLDVRCGGSAVELGDRELHAATVVSQGYEPDRSPFSAASLFCRLLCDAPRLPGFPVYGGNNWYYAYGQSSHGEIVEDSKLIAELSPASGPRPFMVIDDGWQTSGTCCGGGPWISGNSKFPDMPGLAREMKEIGVKPGIWTRPLLTEDDLSAELILHRFPPNESNGAAVLDPTHPDALAIVREDCKRIASWGFDLLKFDFSTYDIFRRWGFEMGSSIGGWRFHDGSRTTAEAITGLYQTIREGSGEMLLIGCNTIGHLAAGYVEIQRTGDDTSGKEWERTRKMGINTLAFRMPQHDVFFAADADCVGITRQMPWDLNERWLELLAASGTPLFVSAAPDALTPEVRQALKDAFAIASQPQPAAEPIDWLDTTCPESWKFGDHVRSFSWSDPGIGDLSS